ncbi:MULTISPECIES: hypothetical protein [Photorhabdus]|nr:MULTISPECIES: hypothetical protein [Photorhabdus]
MQRKRRKRRHRNGRAQSAVSRYTPAFYPQGGKENRLTRWEKGDF